MSIKVYTGFKCQQLQLTPLDLNEWAAKFRKQIEPMIKTKRAEWFANLSTRLFDRWTIWPELRKAGYEPMLEAYSRLMDDLQKVRKNNERNPMVDYSFSVVWIPRPNGETIGVYFTEQEWLGAAWMEQPDVMDFHYQTSTDKPENVSRKEWRHRATEWDAALTSEPFDQCGLTSVITDIDTWVPTTLADMMPHIPFLEARVEAIATDWYIKESTTKTIPEAIKAIERMKQKGTDEAKKFATYKRKVKAKLKPTILSTDLIKS